MLELDHDYTAWFEALVAAKEAGEAWWETIPRLEELPPATFTVDDPTGLCAAGIGYHIDNDLYGVWELASPVSRPMPVRHTLLD